MEAQEKARWVPDHAADKCFICAADFSSFKRRHHCRMCGGLFCATCSSQKTFLPELNYPTPVRVCDCCFDIVKLKAFSGSDNTSVQLLAASGLADLVTKGELYSRNICLYAMKHIYDLFNSNSEDINLLISHTLLSLSHLELNKRDLGTSEALTLLLRLMTTNAQTIQKNALLTLINICTLEECRGIVCERGGMERLFDIRKKLDKSLLPSFAQLVASLLLCHDGRKRLMAGGGHIDLINLLNYGEPEVQSYIVQGLSNLARLGEEMTYKVFNDGALLSLLSLLSSGSQMVVSATLSAITVFSQYGSIRTQIIREGGFDLMIAVLLNENMDLQRQAAECICDVVFFESNLEKLDAAFAKSKIYTLLQQSTSSRIQFNATNSLQLVIRVAAEKRNVNKNMSELLQASIQEKLKRVQQTKSLMDQTKSLNPNSRNNSSTDLFNGSPNVGRANENNADNKNNNSDGVAITTNNSEALTNSDKKLNGGG